MRRVSDTEESPAGGTRWQIGHDSRRALIDAGPGRLLVDLSESKAGDLGASCWYFGPDGWSESASLWSQEYESSLAGALQDAHGLTASESERVAALILGPVRDEWLARGGQRDKRDVTSVARLVIAAVCIVVVLAVVGIVLTVVLIVS